MTSLILALMLAAAPAECPPLPKVWHEPFECKAGLVKTTCGGQVRCLTPQQEQECKRDPFQPPEFVLTPKAPHEEPPSPTKPEKLPPRPVKPSNWHVGPYAELGFGTWQYKHAIKGTYLSLYDSYVEADVGFHAHYLPARLAARAFYGHYTGFGAQAQFYLVQGAGLEWHLDAGVLRTGHPFSYPSVQDVERRWDLHWGTGVEYPITREFVLLGDLKVSTPLDIQREQGWQHDWSNILGNSTLQVRAFAGVAYRF